MRIQGNSVSDFLSHILRCIDDARSGEVEYWRPEDNRPDKLGEYRAVHGMRIDPSKVGGALQLNATLGDPTQAERAR